MGLCQGTRSDKLTFSSHCVNSHLLRSWGWQVGDQICKPSIVAWYQSSDTLICTKIRQDKDRKSCMKMSVASQNTIDHVKIRLY